LSKIEFICNSSHNLLFFGWITGYPNIAKILGVILRLLISYSCHGERVCFKSTTVPVHTHKKKLTITDINNCATTNILNIILPIPKL